MKRALVTGGAGFIGSHTVDALLDRGFEVRILDSLEPPVHVDSQLPPYVPDDAEMIIGDVRDPEAWRPALDGVDVVFHLAAQQDYLTDFSKFATVNDGGTALLYEILVNRPNHVRKVVLGSSQSVYGEGTYVCPEHGQQRPGLRPLARLEAGQWDHLCYICSQPMGFQPHREPNAQPSNHYGVSKYAQELYALTLSERYQIPTVALRYSVTQGPRQSAHNAYSGVCRVFASRILSGLPPIIYEDGRQLHDYVHVRDVVAANLLAAEDERSDYRTFNVGGTNVLSVIDYAALVAETLDVEIEPQIPGLFRVGDTRNSVSDSSSLQALGWRPTATAQEIVQDYVAWLSMQPSFADAVAEADREMQARGVVRAVRREVEARSGGP